MIDLMEGGAYLVKGRDIIPDTREAQEAIAARTGRNPQTGKEMNIPASKAPKFKAGKALKDMIN